jgi:hypothetical protein
MPAPLLRKKPSAQLDMFDPVSAAAWAAGAKATASVVAVIDLLWLNPVCNQAAHDLTKQLEAAVVLTPCGLKKEARTKPPKAWGYEDYILAVRVCDALRTVVMDGCAFVPQGQFALFDQARETATQETISFVGAIEAYAKLVKRERAMERISGNASARRTTR